MNLKTAILVILVNIFINNALSAPFPGKLDKTFNPNGNKPGTVETKVQIGSKINSIAFTPLKKIIAAGYAIQDSFHFALARYTKNGILDNLFNPNGNFGPKKGTVVTVIGFSSSINSVGVYRDGKIIAAGVSRASSDLNVLEQITLAKYNKDGSLDQTFNSNGNLGPKKGIVVRNVELTSAAHAVKFDNQGKIVVAGSIWSPNTGHILAVLRYLNNGNLDPSFNANGATPGLFSKNIGDAVSRAHAIAFDKNRKIVVGGYAGFDSLVFAVVRLNPNGTLDNSFNQQNSGVFTLQIPGTDAILTGLKIDSQGRIYLAGKTSLGFTLARLNPNGTLDTTFNANGSQPGVVITSINQSAESLSLAIDSNLKILVNGFSTKNNKTFFSLARYLQSGLLDSTFNPKGTVPGIVNTAFNLPAGSTSILFDKSNQKIILGGGISKFTLARYFGIL